MQPYPSTELKCLPRLPYSRSQFPQYPLSFNKGNFSCIYSKCWSKDLFISPMIKFFFWVRPHWGSFLILPFPLFFLSPWWRSLPSLHQICLLYHPKWLFQWHCNSNWHRKEEERGTGAGFQLWGHNPWWLWVTGVQGGNARGYTGGVGLQGMVLGAQILSCHL